MPPEVLRSSAPARDEAAAVPPIEEEAESPTRGVMPPTSLKLSVLTQEDVAATSAGEEDVEPPSRDAYPRLEIRPRKRPNREKRLNKREASTSSCASAREWVSGDYAIVSELRQVLVFI